MHLSQTACYHYRMDYKACSFDSCLNVASGQGLCAAHVTQKKRHGSLVGPVKQVEVIACSFGPCETVARYGGRCATHHRQHRLGQEIVPQKKFKGSASVRDENGNKECKRCLKWLPESEFYGAHKTADQLHPYCTWCSNLGRFGLNRNTYMALLTSQGGACAICKGGQWGDGNKYAVDHDHNCCPGQSSCGKCIRGLLCNACNSALGMMSDNPARLRAAADYLEGAAS